MGFKTTFFGLALLVLFYLWSGSAISRPPGVLAPDEPWQRQPQRLQWREMNGYRIEAKADFDIRARVLATERYWFDYGAVLSPIDLVLGWGAMSDSAVLREINIAQGGRFYRWWAQSLSVPRRVIETHSANMHMIPANGEIAGQLKSVRVGNLVHIKGSLVDVSTNNGFRWKTSLTREDTGGGACEIVLVEAIYIW